MAVNPYARFGMRGHMASAQTWSVGLSVEFTAEPSIGDLGTWLAAREADVATWWNAALAGDNSTDVTLTVLTADLFPPTVTTASFGVRHDMVTPLSGGSSTASLPTQLAVVASLRTALPGRRKRGRIYMPVTVAAHMSAHQMTSADANALADATAALLTAINASSAGSAGAQCVVAVPGTGPSTAITFVVVDSVVDTQRRRRDQIAPAFVWASPVT